jgi:acyl carrier protein
MKRSREEVLADLVALLPTVGEGASPWPEEIKIVEDTLLLGDLGWSSIEVVILATATQERYGQLFSFMEWWQQLGRQGHRDISVGEWVEFVHANLNAATPGERARNAG